MDKLLVINWVKLNDLIQETNHTTGFEFYANAYQHGMNDYTSYVIGNYINYNTDTINKLLDLRSAE